MPRISSMYAGAGGSAYNVNMNGPNGGGNKLQGLPPIRNMRSGLVKYVNTRARGDNRNVVFCMNQLGGVGRKSNMFATTADGVKKPCHGSGPSCTSAYFGCGNTATEVGLGGNPRRFYIRVSPGPKSDMLSEAHANLQQNGWAVSTEENETWASGSQRQYYNKGPEGNPRIYLWNRAYIINNASYVRGWMQNCATDPQFVSDDLLFCPVNESQFVMEATLG